MLDAIEKRSALWTREQAAPTGMSRWQFGNALSAQSMLLSAANYRVGLRNSTMQLARSARSTAPSPPEKGPAQDKEDPLFVSQLPYICSLH
jgi:hypothetical protein